MRLDSRSPDNTGDFAFWIVCNGTKRQIKTFVTRADISCPDGDGQTLLGNVDIVVRRNLYPVFALLVEADWTGI